MALLQETDRQAGTDEFMQAVSAIWETLSAVDKADVRATFNALDAYFDANQAAMNQTIPLPARTNLTTKQKAWIAKIVLHWRYIRS